jgi:hypothetical protein
VYPEFVRLKGDRLLTANLLWHELGAAILRTLWWRPLLAVFFAAALSGCAASGIDVLDKSVLEAPPERLGYIVGSAVGVNGFNPYGRSWVNICDKSGKNVLGIIVVAETQDKNINIKTDTHLGSSFSVRIAEGTYYYCDVGFYWNTGMFETTFHPKKKFNIPVVIKPGVVNYIGRYEQYPFWGRNILGMRVAAGGAWAASDHQQEDVALEAVKTPELASLPVLKVVPDFTVPEAQGTGLLSGPPKAQ